MNPNKLNFAFFGTPDVAAETLEILKGAGFLPSLIVTSPDAKQGRKMILTPPPTKVWAEKNNIPFIQPTSNTELLGIFYPRGSRFEPEAPEEGRSGKKFPEAEYDLFVVVAYGKIIPEEILNIPKFGCLNIHYSLLPKYRGASPVESAILNGEVETGVTIQKMVYELDAGNILAVEKTRINPEETAPELRKRLIKIGGELLVKLLETPSSSPFAGGEEQDHSQVTFCKRTKKEDGQIDLTDDPTKNYNKFRAYATWPRTFFFKDGKRIIITKARLENGNFVIERIIPESGKEMDYKG